MAERKQWSEMSKKEKIVGVIIVAVIAFVIIGVFSGVSETDTNQAEVNNNEPAQSQTTVEPLAYTLVEEKDISYQGCSRVAYKIKVADDADSEAVKATGQKIIEDNKAQWDDITVWSYNESESDEFVKNNGFTVDMAEYSTCE